MSMPIQSAKDTPLFSNPGTLPNVSSVLSNWFQKLTFTRVVKTTVQYQLVESSTSYDFMGTRQPFTAQQLLIKPEGQRSWKWEMIHAWPALILNPDEIIQFEGQNYRVMQKTDYKEYGYVEYHICEGYT